MRRLKRKQHIKERHYAIAVKFQRERLSSGSILDNLSSFIKNIFKKLFTFIL